MAVESILFLADKLHSSVGASSIASATSTALGYNKDLVRETDFSLAWKPDDSGIDEYLQADLGSTSALGANPALAYACIAYDARGADQVSITLSADDTGAAFTNRATFTLNKTTPTCDFVSWTVPSTADRYFRLEQLNANRGGGVKTATVFGWSLFNAADVYRIGTDFASDTTGPGTLDQFASTSSIQVMTKQNAINRVALAQQSVELSFVPATTALWEGMRDKFYDIDGSSRPIYMQFDGLMNAAKADFGMARLVGGRLTGFRSARDQYEVSLRFVSGTRFGLAELAGGGAGAGDIMLFDDMEMG